MRNQLIGIKLTAEEYEYLKQYIRDKASAEKRDITISSFIRDILKKEINLEGPR